MGSTPITVTMNNNIENNNEEQEEVVETTKKTFAEQVTESVNLIVDIMNSGKVDPKQVYPSNRYHGD